MVSPLPVIPVRTLDALPREDDAAVLTLERGDEAKLLEYSSIMHEHLVVHEVWKEILPESSLLISSAICGGNIRDRFREAAKVRRCILLIEPVNHRFPLPCSDGCGEPLSRLLPLPCFYSDALCCYYAHTKTAFMLWDTEETLEKKIQLAKDAGFDGIVINE